MQVRPIYAECASDECSAVFTLTKPNRKYCSRACSNRAHYLTKVQMRLVGCVKCGKMFRTSRKRRFCSKECRQGWWKGKRSTPDRKAQKIRAAIEQLERATLKLRELLI